MLGERTGIDQAQNRTHTVIVKGKTKRKCSATWIPRTCLIQGGLLSCTRVCSCPRMERRASRRWLHDLRAGLRTPPCGSRGTWADLPLSYHLPALAPPQPPPLSLHPPCRLLALGKGAQPMTCLVALVVAKGEMVAVGVAAPPTPPALRTLVAVLLTSPSRQLRACPHRQQSSQRPSRPQVQTLAHHLPPVILAACVSPSMTPVVGRCPPDPPVG